MVFAIRTFGASTSPPRTTKEQLLLCFKHKTKYRLCSLCCLHRRATFFLLVEPPTVSIALRCAAARQMMRAIDAALLALIALLSLLHLVICNQCQHFPITLATRSGGLTALDFDAACALGASGTACKARAGAASACPVHLSTAHCATRYACPSSRHFRTAICVRPFCCRIDVAQSLALLTRSSCVCEPAYERVDESRI